MVGDEGFFLHLPSAGSEERLVTKSQIIGFFPDSLLHRCHFGFEFLIHNHLILMVGDEGFEPPSGGVKVRCLTTWRIPNVWVSKECFYSAPYFLARVLYVLFKNVKKLFSINTIISLLCQNIYMDSP